MMVSNTLESMLANGFSSLKGFRLMPPLPSTAAFENWDPACRQRQNLLSGGHPADWGSFSSANPVNDQG